MKKVFISGPPRRGKTSMIKRLVEEFGKDKFCGFWVEEIKEGGKRVGFKISSTWEEEEVVAHVEFRTPYRVGKYFVRKEIFDKFSEKYLDMIDDNKDKIFVLDEIGTMEFYSDAFKALVNVLLNKELPLIAVVHRKFVHLVPYYYWVDNNWWEVYNKVRKFVRALLRKNA